MCFPCFIYFPVFRTPKTEQNTCGSFQLPKDTGKKDHDLPANGKHKQKGTHHWYSALRAIAALVMVSSSVQMCGPSESQPLLNLTYVLASRASVGLLCDDWRSFMT